MCLLRRRSGTRDDLLSEECVAHCTHNATPLTATPVLLDDATVTWRPYWTPRVHAESTEGRYIGTGHPLGGGLNNMLSTLSSTAQSRFACVLLPSSSLTSSRFFLCTVMLSQLLEVSCATNATLLLPTFEADPLNRTRRR